jgi:hypothetical protein
VVPPLEVGPVTGPEAVDRAVRRRFYGGVWRKPPFGTRADARRFKQQLKIYELLHEVPQALLVGILGEAAGRDVPSLQAPQLQPASDQLAWSRPCSCGG